MPVLRCHPSCHVKFDVIAPAGFRILGALNHIARTWARDLWLTSGTEGEHSKNADGTPNPTDPHYAGEAYDLRSNDCASPEEKRRLVKLIVTELCDKSDELLFEAAGGWANDHFFSFLEATGTANEHIHTQRRKGQVYP